jgi:hypothetical protein
MSVTSADENGRRRFWQLGRFGQAAALDLSNLRFSGLGLDVRAAVSIDVPIKAYQEARFTGIEWLGQWYSLSTACRLALQIADCHQLFQFRASRLLWTKGGVSGEVK